MSSAVAAKLKDLQLQSKVIQVPIAQINSDPPAWISQIYRTSGNLGFGPTATPKLSVPVMTADTIASSLLHSALSADSLGLQKALDLSRTAGVTEASEMARSFELLSQPFGRMHHETQCGFKIRGARIAEMHARKAWAEFALDDDPSGNDIRVGDVPHPGQSVLLVLENGVGIVLPAIPGFPATLTIEEGELVDVAYEPSENTWRWDEYKNKAREIRALRAIASSSMTRGAFRLEGDNALEIAKQMQYAKGIDPSLAIYSAYAYHDLQRPDLIRQMRGYMEADLGAPLFDVALLSKALNKQTITAASNVLSPLPLLSQGWALLSAYSVSLPPVLQPLKSMLVPSVWTMFETPGTELVRRAIDSGDIK
jgi:hypothetical protein